jgi:hypothetical protein
LPAPLAVWLTLLPSGGLTWPVTWLAVLPALWTMPPAVSVAPLTTLEGEPAVGDAGGGAEGLEGEEADDRRTRGATLARRAVRVLAGERLARAERPGALTAATGAGTTTTGAAATVPAGPAGLTGVLRRRVGKDEVELTPGQPWKPTTALITSSEQAKAAVSEPLAPSVPRSPLVARITRASAAAAECLSG